MVVRGRLTKAVAATFAVVMVFVLANWAIEVAAGDKQEQPITIIEKASVLIAHYPLDGSAEDASGNGRDGQVNGPRTVKGRIGQALQFDGVDDYVEIPKSVFNALPKGTVAFWIKPNGYDADLFYKETFKAETISGITITSRGAVRVTHDNFGRGFGNKVPDDFYDIITSKSIANGKWSHVVWTWDGQWQTVYLNGRMNIIAESSHGVADHLGAWVRWGRGDTFFNGTIDDIWILNEALSAKQVAALSLAVNAR